MMKFKVSWMKDDEIKHCPANPMMKLSLSTTPVGTGQGITHSGGGSGFGRDPGVPLCGIPWISTFPEENHSGSLEINSKPDARIESDLPAVTGFGVFK